ncbi:MAG: choice-of-anchor E domain-containing protein [Phycisphaerales bacterium JB040]
MKHAHVTHALIASTGILASAHAQTQQQSFEYTYSDADGELAFLTIDRFDDMGGTRELTGVTLTLDTSISYGLQIENNNPFALNAGEFYASGDSNAIVSFVDETPGSTNPFFGLGGVALVDVTGDLAPSDGAGGGLGGGGNWSGPDSLIRRTSATINSVFVVDAWLLPDFQLDGPIEAVIGPFSDTRVDGLGVSARVIDQLHVGTLGVIYEYSVVPTPGAGLAMLAGLGCAARRRR